MVCSIHDMDGKCTKPSRFKISEYRVTYKICFRHAVKMWSNKTYKFFVDENGATATEYGMLAALIAAAIIVVVTNLGSEISNTFSIINTAMMAVGS